MVIIGERGKLSYNVNILDLTIIFIILVLFVGLLLTFSVPFRQAVTYENIETTVLLNEVSPQLVSLIQKNDQLITKSSSVTVKAVEVRPASPASAGSNEKAALKDIYVTLTGQSTVSEALITLGGQEISLGQKYQIKAQNYNLTGTINSIVIH